MDSFYSVHTIKKQPQQLQILPVGCSSVNSHQATLTKLPPSSNLPFTAAAAAAADNGDRVNLYCVLSTFAQSNVLSVCYCVPRCWQKVRCHAYMVNSVCSDRLWLRLTNSSSNFLKTSQSGTLWQWHPQIVPPSRSLSAVFLDSVALERWATWSTCWPDNMTWKVCHILYHGTMNLIRCKCQACWT